MIVDKESQLPYCYLKSTKSGIKAMYLPRLKGCRNTIKLSVYTSFNGSEVFYSFSQALNYIKEVCEEEDLVYSEETFLTVFEVFTYSEDDEKAINDLASLEWLAENEE